MESTEYAFPISRIRNAPQSVPLPVFRSARQIAILLSGLPAALTRFFAGLAATWAGAEPLVKLRSGIRLKPIFARMASAAAVFVFHITQHRQTQPAKLVGKFHLKNS